MKYAWYSYRFPKEGYEAVVKKRFRKKPMYNQDDMDLRLLAPFDDGTIVAGEMVEEITFVNFITGPVLGICLSSLSHLHESANDPTLGQTYVERNKEMRFRMNWGRQLTPCPNHLINHTEEQRRRISVHYNTYTPYHPGYLTLKENMVEYSVETGIKSVAIVFTTPHRNGRDTTRNDGYLILVLRHTLRTTIGTCTTTYEADDYRSRRYSISSTKRR
jgi:MFS superfamily sulfate permease-like transporter